MHGHMRGIYVKSEWAKKCIGAAPRQKKNLGGYFSKIVSRSQPPNVWRRKAEHRKRNLNGDREVLSFVSDNNNENQTNQHRSEKVNSLTTKSGPFTFPHLETIGKSSGRTGQRWLASKRQKKHQESFVSPHIEPFLFGVILVKYLKHHIYCIPNTPLVPLPPHIWTALAPKLKNYHIYIYYLGIFVLKLAMTRTL